MYLLEKSPLEKFAHGNPVPVTRVLTAMVGKKTFRRLTNCVAILNCNYLQRLIYFALLINQSAR